MDAGRRRRTVGLVIGQDDGRLVFRADIAAVDREPAIRADAHENACAGDVARVKDHRPVAEFAKQGFDLAEPRIDLVGEFVRILILGFEALALGVERVDLRLLIGRPFGGDAVDLAQALGVTVGEVGGDLDPSPAFRGNALGFRLQSRGNQSIEQRGVCEPAAVILLEEIAQDHAAGRFIGVEAHEDGAAVLSVSMRRI